MIFKILFIFFKNSYQYFLNQNYFYKNILKELSECNIVFTKIFQWVATEKEITNTLLLDHLKIYTNHCTFQDKDINYKLINDLEKKYQENNYSLKICKKPINAGCINLIFKGILNEKEVILKINRKNIHKKVQETVQFFHFLNMFSFLDYYKIINIIDKNKHFLTKQVDLHYELKNHQMFIESYKEYNYIKIPIIYNLELIKFNNYILMEYINGKTLDYIIQNEKENYIDNVNKFIVSWINTRLLHGDLHSGNILFINENNIHKIVLIDFGLIKKFNIKELNWFYTISKASSRKELLKAYIYIDKIDDSIDKIILKQIEEYYFYHFMKNNDNLGISNKDILNLSLVCNKFNLEYPIFFSECMTIINLYNSLSKQFNNYGTKSIFYKFFCELKDELDF